MRSVCALAFLAVVGCSSPPAPAAPVEARVLSRHLLSVPGETIATVTSVARCGSTLYAADTDSRIHRVDLATGQPMPPFVDPSIMPMALAADCERNRVWAISPLPRGTGLRVLAIDAVSGRPALEHQVPVPCFVNAAVVSGDVLFIAGECIEGDIGERYLPRAADAYYADKRIGVRLDVSTGVITPGLAPYETRCDAGGACVGGSIDASGDRWFASSRAARQIAFYERDGRLAGTIPIDSPAFVTDGTRLPSSASSEQSVRWSTRNSLIHRVFAMPNSLVISHYVADVPAGWKMGGAARPQFKAWMNVLTADGRPVHVDVRLPELPVGRDAEAIYVVDYGQAGRQGAHEAVTVLRIAVPEA